MYSITNLLGKTLSSVTVNEDNDEILFTCTTGEQYLMYHKQDCCEDVNIEDICGDLQDLVGSPILVAEELNDAEPITPEQIAKEAALAEGNWPETCTWTFYKLATIKGYVDIRWFGTSNGYYSERVDFVKV